MKKVFLFMLLGGLLNLYPAIAQTWMYSDTIYVGGRLARAHLWVPPAATNLKGLIIATHTLVEARFVTDPAIRAAAQDQQLGIVYFSPGVMNLFDVSKGDAKHLERALKKLAVVSGFPEVEHAPLLTFGHSTSGIFAKNVAYWKPSRVFGVVYFKSGQIARPSWSSNSIQNVPFLAVNGQYEEFGPVEGGPIGEAQWLAVKDTLMKMRATGHLVSMIVEPGAGHFSWKSQATIAKFITKAAIAKIPANTYATTGPITLKTVSESAGWLSDTTLKATTLSAPSAYANYTRDKKVTFWHLDQELAQHWKSFHEGKFNKTRQRVNFSGGFVDAGRYKLPDQVIGSGETFSVSATSSTGLPVQFEVLQGPADQVGGNTFRKNACMYEAAMDKIYILGYQTGNGTYHYAEQTAVIRLKPKTAGTAQTITFNTIPNKKPTDPPFTVSPTASSGLPTEVCIICGPATIQNQEITLKAFPKGTPTVIVRAVQAGNATYATATPVEKAFKVIKEATGTGCTGTGNITRDFWADIPGITLSGVNFAATPASTSLLTTFEGPSNVADSYASRIRGYICPPATGTYTFWIASDDYSELWLSTSDNPANKVKIANVTGYTQAREWTKYTSQKSAPITLTAGQRYYIEALHKEGSDGDNLAVGWQLPNGTQERPIPGNRLLPYTAANARVSATPEKPAMEPEEYVSVYPNAASEEVTLQIKANYPQDVQIVLTDSQTHRVGSWKKTLTPGISHFPVSLATLSPGVYFFQVTINHQRITKKVVISR
jgi:hypothetical protein